MLDGIPQSLSLQDFKLYVLNFMPCYILELMGGKGSWNLHSRSGFSKFPFHPHNMSKNVFSFVFYCSMLSIKKARNCLSFNFRMGNLLRICLRLSCCKDMSNVLREFVHGKLAFVVFDKLMFTCAYGLSEWKIIFVALQQLLRLY